VAQKVLLLGGSIGIGLLWGWFLILMIKPWPRPRITAVIRAGEVLLITGQITYFALQAHQLLALLLFFLAMGFASVSHLIWLHSLRTRLRAIHTHLQEEII
jgi:hypothetical protein